MHRRLCSNLEVPAGLYTSWDLFKGINTTMPSHWQPYLATQQTPATSTFLPRACELRYSNTFCKRVIALQEQPTSALLRIALGASVSNPTDRVGTDCIRTS